MNDKTLLAKAAMLVPELRNELVKMAQENADLRQRNHELERREVARDLAARQEALGMFPHLDYAQKVASLTDLSDEEFDQVSQFTTFNESSAPAKQASMGPLGTLERPEQATSATSGSATDDPRQSNALMRAQSRISNLQY
jgi:hypothetical protein